MVFKNQSILFKSSIVIGFVSATLLLIAGYIFVHFEQIIINTIKEKSAKDSILLIEGREQAELKALGEHIEFSTNMLSTIAARSLYNVESDGVIVVLKAFMDIDELVAIDVRDFDMNHFSAIWRDREQAATKSGESLPADFQLRDFAAIERNAVHDNEVVGKVVVYYTDNDIKVKVKQVRDEMMADLKEFEESVQKMLMAASMNQLISLFVIIFIQVVLIVLLLTRLVKLPVNALSMAVQSTEQDGDLSRRISITRGDEVGRTVHSVNKLLDHFQRIVRSIILESDTVLACANALVNIKSTLAKNAKISYQPSVTTLAYVAVISCR